MTLPGILSKYCALGARTLRDELPPEPTCITMWNTEGIGMATRTVRLDEEAEDALREVQKVTGLPISEALKHGLHSLRDEVRRGATRTPYDVYRELEHGPGGGAIAPSGEVKRAVRKAIRKKLVR